MLAMIGIWACGVDSKNTSSEPSSETRARPNGNSFPGVDEVAGNLAQLASACSFVQDGGVMTVALSSGEYALINRADLFDGGASINVNGTPCGNAAANNTSRINITGAAGNETVIIDYLAGTFALGSSSNIGINIDLRGGSSDSLRIRGSNGVDNVLLATTVADAGSNGVYTMAVGINGASNPGVRALSFTGVEGVVVSTGPGADVVRTAGQADAGVGGTPFGRTLSGSGPTLTFWGGDDDDTFNAGAQKVGSAFTFNGGAGNDVCDYSSRTLAVSCTLGGSSCGESGEGSTIADDVETVQGGSADDTFVCAAAVACTLNGNAGNDSLTGGGADDTLNGGSGNDTLIPGAGVDSVLGGADTDTVSYAGRTAAVAVTLGANGAAQAGNGETFPDAGVENDSITGVENIVGGNGADTLAGNNFANVITGGPGNDTMNGGSGNDTFFQGAAADGADTIDGQAGEDTVSYGGRSANLTLTLNTSTATTGNGESGENDSIVNVENLICGGGADTVTGDSAANLIEGGAGDDTIDAASGDDIIEPGTGTNAITCGAGNDILLPGGTTTNAANDCEG